MKREEKVKNRSVQYWKINGWATASSLPHHNNIFVLVRLCVVFFLLSKRNNNDPSAKWSKYISWPRTCVWLVKAYIQKDYVISRFTTRWSIPTHTYEKKTLYTFLMYVQVSQANNEYDETYNYRSLWVFYNIMYGNPIFYCLELQKKHSFFELCPEVVYQKKIIIKWKRNAKETLRKKKSEFIIQTQWNAKHIEWTRRI